MSPTESFQGEGQKAHFFSTAGELLWLESLPPEKFVAKIPDTTLFIQVAGAAWDSFFVLKDEKKAQGFLEILRSGLLEKQAGVKKHDPLNSIAVAVAFITVKNDITMQEHGPFLDFCRQNGFDVRDELIALCVGKMRERSQQERS